MAAGDDTEALRRALDVLHGGAWPVGSAVEHEARSLLPELRATRPGYRPWALPTALTNIGGCGQHVAMAIAQIHNSVRRATV